MNEVLVALIGTAGTLGAVALPLMWRAHGRRLDAITEQVANDHSTNLREDIDSLGHRMDMVLDGMVAMRMDVSWIRRDHLDLTHRVALLEGEPLA